MGSVRASRRGAVGGPSARCGRWECRGSRLRVGAAVAHQSSVRQARRSRAAPFPSRPQGQSGGLATWPGTRHGRVPPPRRGPRRRRGGVSPASSIGPADWNSRRIKVATASACVGTPLVYLPAVRAGEARTLEIDSGGASNSGFPLDKNVATFTIRRPTDGAVCDQGPPEKHAAVGRETEPKRTATNRPPRPEGPGTARSRQLTQAAPHERDPTRSKRHAALTQREKRDPDGLLAQRRTATAQETERAGRYGRRRNGRTREAQEARRRRAADGREWPGVLVTP